jgi:hypothetical protein
MRQRIGWFLLTALILAAGWATAAWAANYLKVVGISFNSTNTTYITYDTPSACYQIYRLGVLSGQVCNGYVVPPDCPSDLTTLAPGECNDANGYRIIRDGDGIWRIYGVRSVL